MKHIPTAAWLLAAAFAAVAQAADSVRAGLLTTLSGPGAGLRIDIRIDIRDGFALAVKHSAGKLDGLPAEVIVADKQQNPDTARQTAERMVKRDKVDFMAGIVFSNLLLAAGPPVPQSNTFHISANAGPSPYAGAQSSPYFFSASYQNDNMHEAVGKTVQDKGVKKLALLASNEPAGKDAVFRLADRISALVFGKVIACGTPEEIHKHPDMKQACLGDEVGDEIAKGATA